MAMQAGTSVGHYSPHVVGSAFAQQYYSVLNGSPEHFHKFYHDESIIGRPDSDGTMTYITTTLGISEHILSTDLRRCLIELVNVDTQPSHKDGMLILVTGSITMPDTVKHRFAQSFFLAPQENGGYFVSNDILRYIPVPSAEANESLANHVNGITQIASFPAELETASIKESADLELPSAENNFVNGEVINPSAETTSVNAEVISPSAEDITVKEKVIDPSAEDMSVREKVANPSAEDSFFKENFTNLSANDNSQIETDAGVGTCVDGEKIPEAAPAPPASAKKSYASIVKDTKDSTVPPPIAKSKSKPKPAVKSAENVEKSASVPAKPTQAADTAPPNDKSVSNEQGYSVFVKNLPFNATVEMVEGEFRKFGAIKPGGIQVINRQPDQFCFGFVEFEYQQSMRAAIEASPIRLGSKLSHIEEKRTRTRVVNGVMIHGFNNGNIPDSRIYPGRGGYHGQVAGFMNNGNYHDGDNFREHGADFGNNNNYRDGENFRGQGGGFRNNNNYHDGDNFRGQGGGFRSNNNYRDGENFRGQGGGFRKNNNYHDGDNFRGQGGGFWSKNNYRDVDNFRGRVAGFVSKDSYRDGNNMRNGFGNRDEHSDRGRGLQGNGYHQNGNGYHQNGNGRSARVNGPKQTTVTA